MDAALSLWLLGGVLVALVMMLVGEKVDLLVEGRDALIVWRHL